MALYHNINYRDINVSINLDTFEEIGFFRLTVAPSGTLPIGISVVPPVILVNLKEYQEISFGKYIYSRRKSGSTWLLWERKTQGLTFLDLEDTPTNYSGHSNKILKINSTEDGIIFDENVFTGLIDTPSSYLNKKFSFLNVNKFENGIGFYGFGDIGFIIPYSNFLGVYSSPPTSTKLFDSYYNSTTNQLFFNIDNSWVEYNWQKIIELAPEWQTNLRINSGQLEIRDGTNNWHQCYPLVGARIFYLDSSNTEALDNTNYSKKYYILPETSIRLTNVNHLPIVFSYNEPIGFDIDIGFEIGSNNIFGIDLKVSGFLLSYTKHSIIYYSDIYGFVYYIYNNFTNLLLLKDTMNVVPFTSYDTCRLGIYNGVAMSYYSSFPVEYGSVAIGTSVAFISVNSYWLGILHYHYSGANILQLQKIHIRRTL